MSSFQVPEINVSRKSQYKDIFRTIEIPKRARILRPIAFLKVHNALLKIPLPISGYKYQFCFLPAQGCTTASIPNVNNRTVISEYSYGNEAVVQCEGGLHKVSSETGVYVCRDGRWYGIQPNCTGQVSQVFSQNLGSIHT